MEQLYLEVGSQFLSAYYQDILLGAEQVRPARERERERESLHAECQGATETKIWGGREREGGRDRARVRLTTVNSLVCVTM